MSKNKKGFTMIEMVFVIILIAIISAVFSTFLNAGLRTWVIIKKQKIMMTEARATMERMVREIRSTADTSAVNITTFATNEYAFRDTNGNAINYKQLGTNLMRNADIMLTNVATGGLLFEYLNSSEAATATRANIRVVRINLVLQASQNKIALQSAAEVRNR